LTTAIKLARTPNKAKPSEAGKVDSGVSSGYGTTQHARAQKKAKRSGQAERNGEGRFGVSPGYGNPTRTHAECQTERSGEGGVGGLPRWGRGSPPTTTQHSTPMRKESQAQRPGRTPRRRAVRGLTWLRQSNWHARQRPSRALRPGRAQQGKGVRGSPLTATLQLARAPQKTKPSVAEKGGSGSPPISTQHSKPARRRKPRAASRPSATETGGSGGLPRLRQSILHARRRRQGRPQRPGRAQRKRGFGVLPPTTAIQLALTPRRPSRAQQPRRALRKEGRPQTATPTNAQPKQQQTQGGASVCKTRGFSFASIFLGITRAPDAAPKKSPTHKRTEGRGPVRGSEFTTKVAPKGGFGIIFSLAGRYILLI
jgi:hypothetical protein